MFGWRRRAPFFVPGFCFLKNLRAPDLGPSPPLPKRCGPVRALPSIGFPLNPLLPTNEHKRGSSSSSRASESRALFPSEAQGRHCCSWSPKRHTCATTLQTKARRPRPPAGRQSRCEGAGGDGGAAPSAPPPPRAAVLAGPAGARAFPFFPPTPLLLLPSWTLLSASPLQRNAERRPRKRHLARDKPPPPPPHPLGTTEETQTQGALGARRRRGEVPFLCSRRPAHALDDAAPSPNH